MSPEVVPNPPKESALANPQGGNSPLCFARIFESENIAQPLIFSADESLSLGESKLFSNREKTHIPPALCAYRECQVMWELINSPLILKAEILYRQKIFSNLASSPELPRIVALKDDLYKLHEAVAALLTPIQSSYGDIGLAIEIYRRGGTHAGSDHFLGEATERVQHARILLEEGRAAISLLIPILKNVEGECLAAVESLREQLTIISDEFIDGPTFDLATLRQLAHLSKIGCVRIGTIVSFADVIVKRDWQKVSFNDGEPIYYREGYSLLCEASVRHKNDSVPDKSVTAFAGTNKSGKTESGLKQKHLIQLLAQSTGYSTVARDSNFRIHDFFAYLDRVSADESRNLSTYGTDITNAVKTLTQAAKSRAAHICIDEGFSSTGPSVENQPTMLFALIEGLRHGNARLYVTVHNPLFIEAALAHPDYQVYHFSVSLDGEKKPVYHYKLQPGSDDARSIDVARGMNFYPAAFSVAESIYLRRPVTIAAPLQRYPTLVDYTPEERSALKKQLHRASNERPFGELRVTPPRLFKVFTSERENSVFYAPDIRGEDFRFFGYSSKERSFGCWLPQTRARLSHIFNFLFNAPAPTPAETLEAQRTFRQLMERGCYDELCRHRTKISFAQKFIPMIRTTPSSFAGFNIALNSFHQGQGSLNTLSAAINYLKINQVLLISQFRFQEYLHYLERFADFDCRLQRFIKSRTTESTARRIAAARMLPVESATLHTLKQLALKVEIADLIKDTLSQGELVDLWPKIELKKYSSPDISKDRAWAEIGRIVATLRPLAPHEFDKSLRNALEELPIADPELLQEGKRLLEEVPFHDDLKPSLFRKISPSEVTPAAVKHWAYNLVQFISQEIVKTLPDAPLPAVLPEELRAPLQALIRELKDRARNERYEEEDNYREWPRNIVTALWCEQLLAKENHLMAIVHTLRSYDSIPLQQLSHSLEAEWRESFPTNADGEPDIRAIFTPLSKFFHNELSPAQQTVSELLRPFQDLYSAFGFTFSLRGAEATLSEIRLFAKVLNGKASQKERQRFQAIAEQRSPIKEYYDNCDWGTELEERDVLEMYLEQVARPECRTFAKDIDGYIETHRAAVLQFAAREKIELKPDANERDPQQQLIIWAQHAGKVYLNTRFAKAPLPYFPHNEEPRLLNLASTYAVIGQHLKFAGFSPVTFNESGVIAFDSMRYIANLKSVPQWVRLGPLQNPRVLNGPNMSGKSQYEKATCYELLSAHVTGFSSSKNAQTPILSGIYYVERVSGKDDNSLSAATIDLRNFNELLTTTEKLTTPAYIAADELVSSMPAGTPKKLSMSSPFCDYNACFTVGITAAALQQGHYVSISGHNPTANNMVCQLMPQAMPLYFQYSTRRRHSDAAAAIRFMRAPKIGFAPSEAIPVALSLGFPANLIERGKAVLAAADLKQEQQPTA